MHKVVVYTRNPLKINKFHRSSTVEIKMKTFDVIQNYWGSGLCPSSGILKTTKHSVSETESVSILR
jgi:hypothetical protein